MLKLLPSKCLLLLSLYLVSFSATNAQCPVGYTQAQLNWDNLDYFFNSGGSGPYSNYITDAQEQTQRFAIGTNWLTIVTSSSALVNPGAGNSAENETHTGNIAGYTGEDVQYNPSANGQTITITFNNEVRNTSFALYDIDVSARIDIDAYNSANVKQSVTITLQGSTILSRTNGTNAFVSANATSLGNNDNRGTATISVTNPINRIVITATTIGSDAVFWLSDITACVNGTGFPSNYQQTGYNQPFTGPTQNQPDYFMVTPDNDAVYMVDPTTGNARFLFQDVSKDYVNSFAYDHYNHFLYYISENNSINANNKELKKYDFNTGTSSVVLADIETSLGIPIMNMGVESAGAAFYDGAVYLGIEGGKYDPSGTSSDRTRETIIWRIDFDASFNPTGAYQVYASNAYLNASNTSVHDWGDFIIKNGMLYDFNTARNSGCGSYCYNESRYHHYDLMTGQLTNVYQSPGSTPYNGQAGMTWAGDLYYLRNVVQRYDEAGNNVGPQYSLVPLDGPYATWVGGAGDASENFRPKCDFGDAPATYDPNPVSPAVHERSDNIRLGPTWGTEWVKTSAAPGAAAIDDTDEDGVVDERILTPGSSAFYYREVEVFNNSGSNVRLIAWLDYNGNGIFDASEAITPITVPSSPSVQTFDLTWPSFTCTLPVNSYTYMRVRVTSASAAMTTAHATGYFTNGEVEDYRILVDNFPLGVNLLTFDARTINNKEVTLSWKANEEPGFAGYEVERSADASLWTKISSVNANGAAGVFNYNINDNAPLKGFSYYRLKLKEANGSSRYSGIRSVNITGLSTVSIVPNPVRDFANITIQAEKAMLTTINVINESGGLVHTRTILIQPGVNKHSLPVSGWPLGTYIVQVMLNGEVTNKRIIVMK